MAASAQPIPAFVAYHGVDAAEHQNHFDSLVNQGFRIISVSVNGNPSSPRYSAIYVKRGGPAFVAIHGFDAAGYQAKFNQLVTQGFVATRISVSGSGSNLVFAGIFEKIAANPWQCRFGLTDGGENEPNSLAAINKWARQNKCILVSASIYGTVASRRYAGIWHPNPNLVKWACRPSETSSSHQTWFDAYLQVPMRPDFVDVSEDQLYLSVFRDDAIGDWVARHGMTSNGYQTEFDKQLARGFFPLNVHAGGAGAATRYAAVFARQEEPVARVWTSTGSSTTALPKIDTAVRSFMKTNGVRTGALTILKNGSTVYAKAFTWAEPGYTVTQTGSLFRLASCSKAFAAAAVQKCVDKKLVKLSARVFPLLGITQKALPSQTPDPRVDTITLQNCVDHAGGWDVSQMGWDPVFGIRRIATDLNLSGIPTKMDMARYMYGEPLQFAPGSNTAYSNFGYVLMGLVVEKVSGKSFTDFVRQDVLAQDGITEVFLARSARDQRRTNEVFYDDPGIGWSALKPRQDVLAPYCYGGEGYLTETMDSGGGLSATMNALALFSNKHAVWGLGGRAPGSARTGGMAGVSSRMESRWDGVDFSYVFNTRSFPAAELDAFQSKLTTLLNEASL